MEVRLDKWLQVARMFKTRSQATAACTAGRVRVAGQPAKPHKRVEIGDRIEVGQGDWTRILVVRELLDAYGVADRVAFDASIVRGLAYYTGVVFEAFDSGRKLRAICGGGRYDRLLESLGGPSIPAVGFGFGDAVIEALLEDEGVRPDRPRVVDAVVFPFGESERPAAIALARRLRAGGASVELVLGSPKLKRALADADRGGARSVYLLGPDELARGEVLVRDLVTGEQRSEALEPAEK
jgi:histidyl-tRNA synthetase